MSSWKDYRQGLSPLTGWAKFAFALMFGGIFGFLFMPKQESNPENSIDKNIPPNEVA